AMVRRSRGLRSLAKGGAAAINSSSSSGQADSSSATTVSGVISGRSTMMIASADVVEQALLAAQGALGREVLAHFEAAEIGAVGILHGEVLDAEEAAAEGDPETRVVL